MKTNLIRALLLCGLVCALCCSAAAADGETLYSSEYCFQETDFDADVLSDLSGIFVTQVPAEDVAQICLGQRVIRAGDVLPLEVLGSLRLEPACRDNCDAVLSYQPIRSTRLGEPSQVTIRIKSGKDETPKANDAEFETYKNIPNDGTLTGLRPGGREAHLPACRRAQARQGNAESRRELCLHARQKQGRRGQLHLYRHRRGGQRL